MPRELLACPEAASEEQAWAAEIMEQPAGQQPTRGTGRWEQSPGCRQSRRAWSVENLKTIMKLTKSGSVYCHHHVPVVLNNGSHKLLPIMGQLLHPGKYFLLSLVI